MEAPFQKVPGVESVTVGFTGGIVENPSYEEVCYGLSGHYEAVQISFNPELCTYEQLLDLFWRQIDPTDDGGQFLDRGDTYRTAIFYHNEEQRIKAEKSKEKLQKSGRFDKPIVTAVLPAQPFYPAEEYHQNYHEKNPGFYCEYRQKSGRDEFIKKHWSDN